MASRALRIAILSRDRLFVEALSGSLAQRGEVEVLDGGFDAPLWDGQASEPADVILIDAAVRAQALASTAWAREHCADSKLIVLGVTEEDESLVDFIEAGAHGYLLQATSAGDLFDAIRRVSASETSCSPRVVSSVVARILALSSELRQDRNGDFEPLTLREQETLRWLAHGLRNKEIAKRLAITPQTVKNHVHSILKKLKVGHRREAVRLAYELGLVAQPAPPGLLEDGS